MTGRLLPALALLAAACTKPVPVTQPVTAGGSLVIARMTERADADVVAAVQKRLLSEPKLPGHVRQHGWATPPLYSIEADGSCADNSALVQALEGVLRNQGATELRCVAADSFAPGEPIAMPTTRNAG